MKKLIFAASLFALSGCSEKAPESAAEKVEVTGDDKEIEQEAKSIDAAADEAASIVEEETGEEIQASETADAETSAESGTESEAENEGETAEEK